MPHFNATGRIRQIIEHAKTREYITAVSFSQFARVSHPTARKWLDRAVTYGILRASWFEYQNTTVACRYEWIDGND